jgi:hypothetical protein
MSNQDREPSRHRSADDDDLERDDLWSEVWWTAALFTTVAGLLAVVGWVGGAVSA